MLPFFVIPSHGECYSKVGCSVKDEYAFLPFIIFPQKVESPAKKLMINHQISLANQVSKIQKLTMPNMFQK